MAKTILRFLNAIVSLAVALCLVLAGAYSAYALWDNSRVYAAAENVQSDMLRLKPTVNEDGTEDDASFAELRHINADVCGWVTLDNTQIDHPVLQGEDNLSYINTDVYGNFALAGSIFLDSGNSSRFEDSYSLLYGHHMENSRMFGDLDLYKDETFFNENTTGELILPGKVYKLEILACLLVPASEDAIFQPGQWRDDISGLLDFASENAMHLHAGAIKTTRQAQQPKILAMSTCSTEFTDARTILLARMVPYTPET